MSPYNAKVALLGSCIDYAGTFPPAALSLPDALKKAATFRRTARHPWLMGKMALPVADLKNLTARSLFDSGSDGAAWIFTALGSFGKDTLAEEFARTVEWDLRQVRRCNDRGAGSSCRQLIVAYETRLPPEVGMKTDVGPIRAVLDPILDRFAALTRGQLVPYFEVPWEGDWKHSISAVSDAIGHWIEDNEGMFVIPGLKVRAGGAYVPASEQMATAIAACVSRGLRFKATQGLHHALTKRDAQGREAHGFVNLFTALTLAQGLGAETFGLEQIQRCLSCDRVEDFRLGDKLSWLDFEMDAEAIEAARRHHQGCFGSCSVDEPDEFLAEVFPDASSR